MNINARNLAAALVSLGADVETALLELVATSPALDAKVRAALYHHEELPKLRHFVSRMDDGHLFIHMPQSRPVCVMHAVDRVTQVLDDSDCVAYLQAQFPEYRIEELVA